MIESITYVPEIEKKFCRRKTVIQSEVSGSKMMSSQIAKKTTP
ncbi:hypothetical protein [Blautia liquoris]|nr:hypothetical protein [Blautia liquoris]